MTCKEDKRSMTTFGINVYVKRLKALSTQRNNAKILACLNHLSELKLTSDTKKRSGIKKAVHVFLTRKGLVELTAKYVILKLKIQEVQEEIAALEKTA